MRSNFLPVRFEALYQLILRKAKSAMGQAESLSNLLPPQFRPFFVEFYAIYASQSSIQRLKQLFNDKDVNVRIAAIMSAAHHGRDDLLVNIRSAMTHADPTVKETSAAA